MDEELIVLDGSTDDEISIESIELISSSSSSNCNSDYSIKKNLSEENDNLSTKKISLYVILLLFYFRFVINLFSDQLLMKKRWY